MPMLNLLTTCEARGFKPFIVFTGAATQVGLTKEVPVNESVTDQPVTVYDLHKLFAENYLKYYTRQNVANGVTLRLANVYGPGPKSSSADRGILNLMVRRALDGQPLTVYGDGAPIRDYIFIDDVVSALLHAASQPENCSGKHFFIGSGEGRSISDAVRTVARIVSNKTKSAVAVENVKIPPNQSPIEARNFVADTTGFRQASNWRPLVSFEDGVLRTVEYWMKERVPK
jgi:nucleoside-diphosphate-sugar epimerase